MNAISAEDFSRPRIAVITSGLIDRLIFTNFTSSFLTPTIDAGYSVDYFGSFGKFQYGGWRNDVASFKRDPLFNGLAHEDILLKMEELITRSGGRVRVLNMNSGDLDVKDKTFIEKAPMFKKSVPARHARNTRQGVIRHWKTLNNLWFSMKQAELESQVNYTYVLYQKDDFLWMQPFQFDKVLEAGPIFQIGAESTSAQAMKIYTHMCQSKHSSWKHSEHKDVVESVLIFERAAADGVLGSVYNELGSVPNDPSIENLLARMAASSHATVNMLPARLIPGQRVGFVDNGHEANLCLHITCNSHDAASSLMDISALSSCSGSNATHRKQ